MEDAVEVLQTFAKNLFTKNFFTKNKQFIHLLCFGGLYLDTHGPFLVKRCRVLHTAERAPLNPHRFGGTSSSDGIWMAADTVAQGRSPSPCVLLRVQSLPAWFWDCAGSQGGSWAACVLLTFLCSPALIARVCAVWGEGTPGPSQANGVVPGHNLWPHLSSPWPERYEDGRWVCHL